jgi:acetolactate synthase-1/2/3 large subunit
MKASDAVADFLAAHDIPFCFEIVGGMITHLLDSLSRRGKIRIVSMHHEQAAAFAAEGVARQTRGKKLGVCMGTSGPGGTNMITGIGSCWFDSVPALFITGQVNTDELRQDRPVRQQGFQELDIVTVVRSITKHAAQVTDPSKLLPELHLALSVARSGRYGPVLIDIPNNVQRMDIPDEEVKKWVRIPLTPDPMDVKGLSDNELDQLLSLCKKATRPLVLFGGGAIWADGFPKWVDALNKNGIPYISTLMGHQRMEWRPCFFEMLGTYGTRIANWAVQNCDLLLVIGARLDVRQTGSKIGDFARKAKVVQIDIDPGQLENRVKAELNINIGAETFYERFKVDTGTFPKSSKKWMADLNTKKKAYDKDEYVGMTISPSKCFELLNRFNKGRPVEYVCDVGNHQMWAGNLLRLGKSQAVHYCGGMGAMGFGLPASIGIAMISGKKTINIAGDGSLQINIHELDTLYREKLDVTVVVLNNRCLGMVKTFQDLYFDGLNQSTKKGYSCPSFVDVAKGFKVDAVRASTVKELEKAFGMMNKTKRPLLIEVMMEQATDCRPRLLFGNDLDDQDPKIK